MPKQFPRKTMLSETDLRILELIAHGYTSIEIAEAVGLRPRTITEKRDRIYHFLGAKNAPHAIYIAIGEGLLI